ncbi:hypothetical protein M407DRAFT_241909 [Tulasnella calospora MUT 4182]|uniref:Uncharacterized protein n=1 Tax=Tulasnella calospora MUT 4182 TaxID=1051891 RepID=A0A0C3QHD5_9AGAM|nr:hypothetical protein M407DRAFT_241909 [Tulasnella calospora MUT 4182]
MTRTVMVLSSTSLLERSAPFLGSMIRRVYIQNDDTYEVIEYAWSDATPYTEANNLYATPFIEQGTASASSLQLSRGKPNLYLWTVGAQGGNVKEDDDTHGRNAKSCLYV